MGIIHKEDILGLWSEVILDTNSFEDNDLAFYENGTGFLSWTKLSMEIMDEFTWSITNGLLRMEGTKQYTFDEKKLKKIEISNINIKGINVRLFIGKRSTGKEIESIELSEPVLEYVSTSLGLIGRDIDKFDYYTDYRSIIKDLEGKV